MNYRSPSPVKKDFNNTSRPVRMEPMEIEVFHPRPSSSLRPRRRPSSALDRWLFRVRVESEYAPRRTASLLILSVMLILFWLHSQFGFHHHFAETPLSSSGRSSTVPQHATSVAVEFHQKAAQIDHWCHDDNDDCACHDFSDPVSREEAPGWNEAFLQNVNTVVSSKTVDVIFWGDDLTAAWRQSYNTSNNDTDLAEYWNKTFNGIKTLTLGIAGDTSPNVLWRLQHGEWLSSAKIFWIQVGSNDLQNDCSDDAVVLGILHIVEHVRFLLRNNNRSKIVVQGLLPRSSHEDGSLEALVDPHTKSSVTSFSRYQTNWQQRNSTVNEKSVLRSTPLWSSIVHINTELQQYCQANNLVFFNTTPIFLDQSNPYYQPLRKPAIVKQYMSDFIHPSREGMKALALATRVQVKQILNELNESSKRQ